MPLVTKHWGSYGLKDWTVVAHQEGLEGAAPAHRILAILHWDSIDGVKKATTSEEGKVIFEDVPNFTDIVPVFNIGDVVGKAAV